MGQICDTACNLGKGDANMIVGYCAGTRTYEPAGES